MSVTPKELQTERDKDECATINRRLSDILTATANALKGEPAPLTLHDWSDLPTVAEGLRERLRETEIENEQLKLDVITTERIEKEIEENQVLRAANAKLVEALERMKTDERQIHSEEELRSLLNAFNGIIAEALAAAVPPSNAAPSPQGQKEETL